MKKNIVYFLLAFAVLLLISGCEEEDAVVITDAGASKEALLYDSRGENEKEEKEPVKQETRQAHAEEEKTPGLININTASASELTKLKGIGEKRAGAIVEYREKNGSFQSIDDIMKVRGIKEGIFKKIRDQITV